MHVEIINFDAHIQKLYTEANRRANDVNLLSGTLNSEISLSDLYLFGILLHMVGKKSLLTKINPELKEFLYLFQFSSLTD